MASVRAVSFPAVSDMAIAGVQLPPAWLYLLSRLRADLARSPLSLRTGAGPYLDRNGQRLFLCNLMIELLNGILNGWLLLFQPSQPAIAEAAFFSIERKQARVARNGAAAVFAAFPGGFISCTVSLPVKVLPAFFKCRPAS